jgi:S-DNA-T family DNA segregation ATPase FtsK/SpoIIIE
VGRRHGRTCGRTGDDGKGTTKRGIKRADVAAAVTRRDADRVAA